MARIVRLFRHERASGLVMIAALVLGLVAANTPLAWFYAAIHHTPVHFRVGPLVLDRPLVSWINEGLMVIFFLVVGLEIKRQILEGHLSTLKRAALPAFAALGGMIVPAAIYAGLNWTDPAAIRGWAIPTATDIVLAFGILSLLGPRVPVGLRVFLTALAIFDDIGAVLIIGLFYGEPFALEPIAVAGLAIVGLVLLNRFRVVRPFPYVVAGVILWLATLESGVEPVLAGIFIAIAVPLRAPGCRCSSPLRQTERRLHPWAVLGVAPLFVFFNAGIVIDADIWPSLFGTVSIGVVGGLFLGKQLGVFACAWAAAAFGLGQLPAQVTWGQLYGVALLAGIGFTMSLFVATLAFSSAPMIASAKLAVLVGSTLSAAVGLLAIRTTAPELKR